jgi:hypothetical protein
MQFATPLARGQQVYCSPIFQNGYLNSTPNVDHSVYVGFLVYSVILGQVSLRLLFLAPVSTFQPILRQHVYRYRTTPLISQAGSMVSSYPGPTLPW